MKILIPILFSIMFLGITPVFAAQHPEPVEMKLEVYIFDVIDGVIKICVDVYCHSYYEGSGSISKTFLVPPGNYLGSLEWTHTKTDCPTSFEKVCAASGKVVVPNEKDGPLTMQIWGQYDLGAQVFNNQKITFNVEIPSFAEPVIIVPSSFTTTLEESLPIGNDSFIVLDTAGIDTGFDPLPDPIPDPTPDPTPEPTGDMEQRMTAIENEVNTIKKLLQAILAILQGAYQ